MFEVSKFIRGQIVPRHYMCDFENCTENGVRIICWDSNNYENDKYAWACEKHAAKYEVKNR